MEEARVELRMELMRAIETADIVAAEGILDRYAGHHSYQDALSQLLDPVLSQLGEAWGNGKPMVLAQGYFAAKLTERLFARSASEGPIRPLKKELGPVIVGNIEDDFHSLGRRMVTTFLKASGWEVHDLGNDVPVRDFVVAATKRHARVVGVSAMMYSTAATIRTVRQSIDDAGLRGRLQLAVGGAVFNLRPELVDEVGGDGTAHSALGVSALFESLATQSLTVGDAP